MSLDPPVAGFFYAVRLAGASVDSADSSFKEVSGLSVELAVEEVSEGGENRFKHQLPTGSKYPNLVLKRGLAAAALPFFKWCQTTLQNGLAAPIVPKDIQVVLLDEKAQPRKTWSVVRAWPVKWNVSDLNSMEGQVLIETLELSYQYFDVS